MDSLVTAKRDIGTGEAAAKRRRARDRRGRADIHLAELYAPCTIVEVLVSEALGLVPRGEGELRCAEG